MQNRNLPLITVVTVTHNLIKNNREQTFEQCLRSVREQTYPNIKHIVVDGASKDGTKLFLQEMHATYDFKYISEPDTGIYHAMNKGIGMAAGDYVTFLNSDDFYHDSEGLYESVTALETTDAAFSYAPISVLFNNKTIDTTNPHSFPDVKATFRLMPFSHQSMVYRVSVLKSVGGYDESFKSAGDYELLLRLALGGYESVEVLNNYCTFRAGGFSSLDPSLEYAEVARAYRKNYARLCKLTTKESERIYCQSIENIPPRLARKLAEYPDYFDYDEYKRQRSKTWAKRLLAAVPKFTRSSKQSPLTIIGAGPGFERANRAAWEGREIWCTSSIFKKIQCATVSPRLIFQLHDEEVFEDFIKENEYRVAVLKRFPSLPRATVLPVKRLVGRFGEIYTSSMAWMLAYAFEKGYTDINVHGVHMNEEPYIAQRDSFFYLLGALRAAGVTIRTDPDSGVFMPAIRYGARM